jgi:DNA-binding CsgD family transcriptional regulator/tetratricopeptide (TPR) repeat protein
MDAGTSDGLLLGVLVELRAVHEEVSERSARIAGRESELAAVCAWFGGGASALILCGAAGIGKTTLWEAGIAAARGRGLRVLVARPSGTEAQHSFAALIDLCDGVDIGALPGVPAPQVRALEVALLRADPSGVAPSSQAIALGLLNGLRVLSARAPLLVALDDLQWLDQPSSDALEFVARRLESEAIRFLIARRPGRPPALERSLERRSLERLDVGPLSFGAIRRLLSGRLGLNISRQLLRWIVDSTLGNPLFALELGRSLVEEGLPGVGEEFSLPAGVEELLEVRVAQLSRPVRRLLLAAALSGDLRLSGLPSSVALDAVEEAVEAGVLVIEGDRVRPSHPLLAAAARRRSRARQRRELHFELVEVAADEQLRARHLALATSVPDAKVADRVAAAALGAAARGDRRGAVELGEYALRLTPADRAERVERLLELASYLEAAGELQRVTDVLSAELEAIPPGSQRARAWLLLSEGADVDHLGVYRARLERALEQAQDDPALRARVVAKMSSAVIAVERIHEAEASALEVLPGARKAGPEVERPVLFALAWARGLAGRSVDDLCERYAAASESAGYLAESPERVRGQRLVWRGELEQARARLEGLRVLADERGELPSYVWAQLHVCELELRIGHWAAAERVLGELAETLEEELFVVPVVARCHALLAAGRGLPEEAENWAEKAIARAEAVGTQWDWLEALRARGIAALLAHDPARALESAGLVWEHTLREGVDEPGVFPVAPELVEALIEIGKPGEAQTVVTRLGQLAERHEHPWGLVTTARCAALVQLGLGDSYEDAAAALAQAAEDYGRLGLLFDRARSLFGLGRAQRRLRKWGAARNSLEQTVAAFEQLDSPGWAEEAGSELARVGARRPSPPGELTGAEHRVATLAASGLSNKEIAQTLYVTVNTVEAHLSHAYVKLGVTSRTQLATRLSPQ